MITSFGHTLLLDNNRVSNFFNLLALKKSNKVKKIFTIDNENDALDFIDQNNESGLDTIFININSASNEGWKFLEKYDSVYNKINVNRNVIVLYKNKLTKEEKNKLDKYSFVSAVANKNLDIRLLKKIEKCVEKKRANI